MRKGRREYFKHNAILMFVIGAFLLLVYLGAFPEVVLLLILIPIVIYAFLFSVELIFNIGPFKYIGKLYVEDADRERQTMRSKQPWD